MFLKAASNLLFPPLCRCCGDLLTQDDGSAVLCPRCLELGSILRSPLCDRCGAPVDCVETERPSPCGRCPTFPIHFERVRAAVRYESPYRELIHEFKFRASLRVRPFLTAAFLTGANRFYSPQDFDAVAPVPLHWWRRFRREFNQAEILSLPLAESWGIPHLPGAAVRKRLTLPQSRLSGDQRTLNMKGMFEPGGDSLTGARVLLVDDVMTTGATLSACADALLRGGAYTVSAMTLARRL